MSLSEFLPLNDIQLNAKIKQLDIDTNSILERLQQGNAVRNNEHLIRDSIACLRVIREINQRVARLISGLRSHLSLHLENESNDWKRQSWHGSNPEELEVSRELNELIHLQIEIKEIKDSITEKLSPLGVDIIL